MKTYDQWKTTEPDDPNGPEHHPTPEEEQITWLDSLMQRVKTRHDERAPCGYVWCATINGFDLLGVGRTEAEAIIDLDLKLKGSFT